MCDETSQKDTFYAEICITLLVRGLLVASSNVRVAEVTSDKTVLTI